MSTSAPRSCSYVQVLADLKVCSCVQALLLLATAVMETHCVEVSQISLVKHDVRAEILRHSHHEALDARQNRAPAETNMTLVPLV